ESQFDREFSAVGARNDDGNVARGGIDAPAWLARGTANRGRERNVASVQQKLIWLAQAVKCQAIISRGHAEFVIAAGDIEFEGRRRVGLQEAQGGALRFAALIIVADSIVLVERGLAAAWR